MKTTRLFFFLAFLFLFSACKKEDKLVYKDPKAPVEERVADLLKRMTLEEKIGQMTQISTSEINSSKKGQPKSLRFRPYLDTLKADSLIRNYHIGSFLAGFAVSPQDWYEFSYKLQQVNLRISRLGIPIIYGNDHIHGANYVSDATVFPQQFTVACSFNNEFAKEMGRITATEIADLGQHWNFAPVLGIGRNPYWPRQYETFGEATYLAATMGAAYIKALENSTEAKPYKIAACAKHFIGYSDPRSGWDRMPAIISDQELYEYFVPPFKAAIDAGVKTFMINSGEVNGVPVHASEKLINGLLRKELGFKGVVLSDWADILQLVGQHKVAHDEKEATQMALLAGIDMSMTASTTSFCRITKELVEEGKVPESIIDSAVARILRLKFELGLFENPYPRNDRFDRIGSAEHKQAALQAARESIVLLKNEDNVLPLAENTASILIVGPTTHSKRNICGGWTVEWGGAPESAFPDEMETVFTAMQKAFPNARIDTLSAGSFETIKNKAQRADFTLLAVGEEPYAEGRGNISDLTLPQDQLDLIRAVQAAQKPHAIAMFAGRPRLIAPVSENTPAFIFAGLPGYQGATALAEIISGKTNPSAKLAFTYPASVGHIVPYNCKVHDKYRPAWGFGHGLSYTQFEYSALQLSDSLIRKDQTLTATVKVTNTGDRAGKQAVLWFLSDKVRRITPARRELKFYEKQSFQPGETKTFSFEISPKAHLAFPNQNGKQIVEEGYFEIHAGNLTQKFYLQLGDGKQKTDTKMKDYLQQDI